MTRIKRLKTTFGKMLAYFDGMTEEMLHHYDYVTHDGGIEDVIKSYLFCLDDCVLNRRYYLVNNGRIKIISSSDPFNGIPFDIGQYRTAFGRIKPVHREEIPADSMEDLKDELRLLTNTLHGFKIIRWAMDKKLKGARSDFANVDLKHHSAYAWDAYNSLEELDLFHSSGRARPFLMGAPGRPSASESNKVRNELYDAVNGLFE
ncbi:MAG: hypothetical protein HY513_00210 [Candidatus Aenigmarchaeota archaeon]|nr:hypothetical protein [Candidatus Aenigmarchaeota archaeon]